MILQKHLYEKDPGDARDVSGAALESQGSPGHAPGTRGRPGTPGHAPGNPGDVPETPRGRPWDLLRRLLAHKNGHSSTNIQRQKLSIAVFEPAYWDPTPEGLPRAGLVYKKAAKLNKNHTPVPGFPGGVYG